MKLIQKDLFKGTREFEIVDDAVYVRIKGLLKEQQLTVSLSQLDPEPIVKGTELEFHSRAGRGPMLSLYLNKPTAAEFNAFIDVLKLGILGEEEAVRHEAPGWNVYDEPPDFEDTDEQRAQKRAQPVNADRLAEDITLLKSYLNERDIKPFLDALETLKNEPQSEAAFQHMVDAYNALGINQGAVLTYSTYLKVLLARAIW